MIIGGRVVPPDIWEQIKGLDILDGMNYLYNIGYFGGIAPKCDPGSVPYSSIFETGVRFDFEIFRTFDYGDEIRQLELLMKLKHKYKRSYDAQLQKLDRIYEKLRILNALHE